MRTSFAILKPFMRIPMGVTMRGSSTKKSVNVSLSPELLEQARKLNLNLSAVLTEALTEKFRAKQRQEWLKANQEAIESVNQFVEENGSFSDFQRSF